ncbi:DUF1254 domain-containing protein [Methylocella sp.]|jgi:hypothetical protein|uniref:DUF1254 domain-containing protein n=1 Tax=Methylocella sp. TaxID=1978226 RepID=UPI003C1F24AD
MTSTHIIRATFAGSLLLTLSLAAGARAEDAAPAMTAEEAHSIGVDAYIYLYPLVTMDITRKQLTNSDGFGRGPMNEFHNVPAYPPATDTSVVRTNYDTLYSIAYLDLSNEPMVVSAPDTDGRYFMLPMIDMWTDVFASPGSRTTGTKAAHFLVTPQGWRPDLREAFAEEFKLPKDTQRIESPTPYVWIIGRTKTDGPADYPAVRKIQAGYVITPLSQWGKTPSPTPLKVDPTVDMKTPPKAQVDALPAAKFFAYGAELMKKQPPHVTDQPILAEMKKVGLESGKPFDLAALDPEIAKALESAPADALALMAWKVKTLARVVNGWSMNTDTMGVYGNYYLKRAIVAQMGLGANLPEDAVYPLNLFDKSGKPLDGANKYTIHFDKAELPPVDAFWSITLYDPAGNAFPNSIDRQAVSSWMPFVYNADGSLDLYFQNENPGKEHEANWLPAPQGGFNLTMRLYAPRSEILVGKWNPPPVDKAGASAE